MLKVQLHQTTPRISIEEFCELFGMRVHVLELVERGKRPQWTAYLETVRFDPGTKLFHNMERLSDTPEQAVEALCVDLNGRTFPNPPEDGMGPHSYRLTHRVGPYVVTFDHKFKDEDAPPMPADQMLAKRFGGDYAPGDKPRRFARYPQSGEATQ